MSYYNPISQCNNCRRRRIQCDGAMPLCTPCQIQPSQTAPCGYTATDPAPAMYPRPGYTSSDAYSSDSSGSLSPESSRLRSVSNSPSPGSSHGSDLDVFITRFNQSPIFYLGIANLRTLFQGQISTSLRSAVYLWNAHLTAQFHDPMPTIQSLAQITALAPQMSDNEFLQTLQAQVLISYYCLDIGLKDEGPQIIQSAWALASWAGLHIGGNPSEHRATAFWALLLTHNMWVTASGRTLQFPFNLREVSVSWPTNGRERGTARYPISEFMDGLDHPEAFSPFALLIKASILLERVITFCMGVTEPAQFLIVQSRLRTFQAQLPALESKSTLASPGFHTLLVARCFINVAYIRLCALGSGGGLAQTSSHANMALARSAANRFVSDLRKAGNLQWKYVEPVLGPLMSTTCFCYSSALCHAQEAITNKQVIVELLAKFSRYSETIRQCYAVVQRS